MTRRLNRALRYAKDRFLHPAEAWWKGDRLELEFDRRIVPDPDRHGIAIAAIVKDEAPYIEEWLAFHTQVGVRSFYIYDNGSTDETVQIASQPRWQSRVHVLPWRNFSRHIRAQPAAYHHAVANFGQRYRWMAFIDVDEFVFPKHGGDLNGTLRAYSDVPGVSLPWHMFGPNGHHIRPPGLVIENFTARAPLLSKAGDTALLNFKTIADPAEIRCVRTHYCEFWDRPGMMINDAKKAFPRFDRMRPENTAADHIQLNHYYTRSMAESDWKLSKGRVSKGGSLQNHGAMNIRAKLLAAQTVQDASAARFAEAVKAFMGMERIQAGD